MAGEVGDGDAGEGVVMALILTERTPPGRRCEQGHVTGGAC
jgi:hypothetical protein